MAEATLEALLRRDRLVVGAALAALTAAAWVYLIYLASDMSGMSGGDMSAMAGVPMLAMSMWSWVEVATLAVMWAVMMVAMMAPAAAPMILMFAAVHRRRAAAGGPAVPTTIFVLGYVAVWTAFSGAAALAQA